MVAVGGVLGVKQKTNVDLDQRMNGSFVDD
jgi:hypothetical protein